VHYPVPIPKQPALASQNPDECPLAALACDEVLSLPLHPGLSDEDARSVADSVLRFAEV
jgi:dTDP-4-amino-4,6-dideoxygalactose transaminase